MTSSPNLLETLIRQSGQTWMLNTFDPDVAVATLREFLDEASRAYARRYPDVAPFAFDEHALSAEQRANPDRIRGLLQAVGETPAADDLVMAWRIMLGDTIKRVHLHYAVEAEFRLQIELEDPVTGRTQQFDSDRIESAALMRHWGIARVNGRPLFDGYDPLPNV